MSHTTSDSTAILYGVCRLEKYDVVHFSVTPGQFTLLSASKICICNHTVQTSILLFAKKNLHIILVRQH